MKGKDFSLNIGRISERLISFVLREISSNIPIGPRFCCYCQKNSPFFLPYGAGSEGIPPLMKVLDVIGSDVDNYLCPKCFSHDRERHLKLYFDALELRSYIAQKNILHFAPELRFSEYISEFKPLNYLKADLHPNSEDVKRVDMLSTGLDDCQFDMIIANHVLEHVSDIEVAMRELWRVLKAGGLALFQTPFSPVLNSTFEDRGIVTPEARLQAFGQEDHIRLFGGDIVGFITSFGFRSRVGTHERVLSEFDATYHGVNIREPLFLFERLA